MKIRNSQFAWPRWVLQITAFLLLIGWLVAPGVGQQPKLEISPGNAQLVDKEPFDQVFLDKSNEYAVLDILPLVRIPSKPFPDRGTLVFELSGNDEFKLELPWVSIIDYKSFKDLLLEEAELLLEAENYARAFRNLLYVYDRGGKNDPALRKQLRRVLIRDGKENFESGNHSLALSIFEDIYQTTNERIDNTRPIDMIMRGYDLMISERFDRGEYEGVRVILSTVERKYGDAVMKLQDRWSKRLRERNREFFEQAEQAISSGDAQEAHSAARRAIYAAPDDPESAKLLNRVIEDYPLVYVGVSQTSPNGGDPTRTENWAARRMGRLTQRTIIEFDGLSDEGGRYRFLNGTFERVDDVGMMYKFRLSNESIFGIPPITAFQLSQQLLERADPESPLYFEPWGKVVGPISIEDADTVLLELRIPFVRPEALLQVPYESAGPDGVPIQNGPYIVTGQEGNLTQFSRNPQYKVSPSAQYPEMVEVQYANLSEAVDALLKGDIDVIDRVPLQNLRELSRNPNVQLSKYIVPSVHMLIPNIRNDFMKSLDFRSGLFRAIDRQGILTESIAAGREVSGCELLTGPFPLGTDDNDQIGYAYNPKIAQVNDDIVLATVLISVVKGQLEDRAREKRAAERIKENNGQPPAADQIDAEEVIRLEYPELILAYPKGEVSRVTCQSIRRMWGEIGIKVTLRELPEGQTAPEDNEYDFLYVEVAMSEPLTDIEAIFGNQGIAKNLSAPVQQLVRKLSYSTSWQKAGRNLRQMHRQVLNNVAVIPLFQIQEYFAYRKNVKNIGRDLVNLYENIDEWEVVPLDKIDSAGK
ncbi:ABC transporter substrate-binding protein [bacterium]|nr:ABC transporter substrate-binding protein [bacterium]